MRVLFILSVLIAIVYGKIPPPYGEPQYARNARLQAARDVQAAINRVENLPLMLSFPNLPTDRQQPQSSNNTGVRVSREVTLELQPAAELQQSPQPQVARPEQSTMREEENSPQSPESPESSKSTETTETTESSESPECSESSESPESPESSKSTESPESPESSESPESPQSPQSPQSLESPVSPQPTPSVRLLQYPFLQPYRELYTIYEEDEEEEEEPAASTQRPTLREAEPVFQQSYRRLHTMYEADDEEEEELLLLVQVCRPHGAPQLPRPRSH